ncbi:UvrD-helicase domain-containing protein [Phaeobacter inhibens]|uniref:UvrD-helicase domain-containing protein n=1 Tax=Phaeobacter inhibens TaxID=221822 RepID=UPI0021A8F3D9|nr:UvrD-helicase domain-containing protein [Phaeobacter inhibens]
MPEFQTHDAQSLWIKATDVDGVELARQAATRLHKVAVSDSHDPTQPYEFAIAEANRRGFDVEETSPSSPLLEGSRATVIHADRLILHENAGTAFEKAFLVAHEIGHLELGDGAEGEQTTEIDPTRAAEPSPIGMERVVDYGRRQRREVQMDLFAREFLLPRAVVKSLHLESQLTASDIAQRFGAPFDVVAQQLFDALLLPEVISELETESVERTPNALQAAAASHRGNAYLLEAGPGTGKTQTLVARVDALLEEGVDPRRILLLTFSNKAAGEMADRIARKHSSAATAMWIGTFHAFGLDIVRRFHGELGLPTDPRMMDRIEAVELLEEEFPCLDLAHYRNLYDPTQIISDILQAISRAKDEVVDPARYAGLAEEMAASAATEDQRVAAAKALEVARVYEAYERLKANVHCVDFGDLISMPVRLLESRPDICEHLRSQYDHILVDEYQDVNRSSVRLLTALCPDGRNLWAVGDAKQSIYRFRGASSFNMARFGVSDFPGGERGRLRKNYRSVEEIVDTFSDFAADMIVGDTESGLEAVRGSSGARSTLRKVAQAPDQIVAIAEAIQERHRDGCAFREQVVLCTGNEKLSEIGQSLERLGVPVLFLGSLFERSEIKDLMSLLTILSDKRAMGLVRVACIGDFKIPIDDVGKIYRHLRSSDGNPKNWLENTDLTATLSECGQMSLANLKAAFDGFDDTSEPWAVIAHLLLDRTRIAARLSISETTVHRTQGIAIWQFLNFLRSQPTGQGRPIKRLLDRVRRLVRLGDDRDLRQLPLAAQGIDAVRLMTIHGAKGLEFETVHLPGLNADTIPRKPPPPPCPPPDGMVEGTTKSALKAFQTGQAEEQECLFYVAMSRARDRLLIYAPTQKLNGSRRNLSSFIDRLGSRIDHQTIQPGSKLAAVPEMADVMLEVSGRIRFSGAQLSLYERCPRRFFYTHVLQVGGRRTATPFMQMHEAVRAVVKEVIAGNTTFSSDADLRGQVAKAFSIHDLSQNGYVREYTDYAVAMVSFFLSTRGDHTPETPTAVKVRLGDEELVIEPDDILLRADGSRAVRKIQTGHFRKSETDDVGTAAFLLAARQAFPGADVEFLHLSDETTRPMDMTDKKLGTRRDKLTKNLQDIRSGRFPAKPSARVCPGCPAFFVCGPTPDGILKKKFD